MPALCKQQVVELLGHIKSRISCHVRHHLLIIKSTERHARIIAVIKQFIFTDKLHLPDDEAEEVARDMEGIITFYCKSRNEKYRPTSGLTEVLAPFMTLELPMNDVYNCFYAMLYKYIPRYILVMTIIMFLFVQLEYCSTVTLSLLSWFVVPHVSV